MMDRFVRFLCFFCVFLFFGQTYGQLTKPSVVVSSILAEPFLMEETYLNENGTEVVEYVGYIRDLLDEVAKITGTPYTLVVRKGQLFGSLRKNGTWSGLIGELYSGTVNMSAAPITPTSSRLSVVDFSVPFMSFAHVIIMRRPTSSVMNLQERLQRLFSPLSQGIYLMSILAWLVTSAVLYIIAHTNPYEWRRMAKDKEATLREGESFTCINTFWFTMSTFVWQGFTRAPRSIGGRTVVLFWWAYVLLFIAMYIASMTNFLRVGPTNEGISYSDIQSVEDLAAQSTVKTGALQDSATLHFLTAMKFKTPNMRNFLDGLQQSLVPDIASGIQKVRDSKKPYAFLSESAMAQYYAGQSPCDIYMVGRFNTFGSYSFAFPHGSDLKNSIDYALLRLQELGVLKNLFEQWFTGECTDYLMDASYRDKVKVPPFIKVDLGSFSGALVILGIGLVLGSLITGIEFFIYKHAELEEKKERDEQRRPINDSSSPKREKGDSHDSREPVTDV